MKLNLKNASILGANKALCGERIQVNTGFEVRAVCKFECMDKRKAVE